MVWTKIAAQFPKVGLEASFPLNNLPVAFDVKKLKSAVPDTIRKTEARLNRKELASASKLVLFRDGSKVALSSLLSRVLKPRKVEAELVRESCNETPYFLRKIRVGTAIHSELVSYFSSGKVPKLLRVSEGHWVIQKVATSRLCVFLTFSRYR
jgi:hypothetical protein